jgi:hypothetical protein
VWFSNIRNNFAPYAGFMLKGYKTKRGLERSREKTDDASDDAPVPNETTGDKRDDTP